MRLLLLAALLVPLAAAVPEADAPTLHPDVLAAWHEPESVSPGTQWHGFLRLRPGHGIVGATYQVCNVGDGFCFAPPTNASLDGDVLSFDTMDYLANGRPVDWEAGWTVGVKWCLQHAAGGNCTDVPAQSTDGSIASHYLTFRIAGEEKAAPGLQPVLLVAGLVAVALLRRR